MAAQVALTLREQAQYVGSLYADLSNDLMQAVAKRIGKGIYAPGWTEAKLAQVKDMQSEASRILASAQPGLKGAIQDAVASSHVMGGVTAGTSLARVGVLSTSLSGRVNLPALRGLLGATFGTLDSTHPPILRSVMDAYRDTIARASIGTVAGAETRVAAAQRALNGFADKGITSFTDSAGRKWAMDTYAEMAVRSATTRAFVQGKMDTFAAAGITLFQVSSTGTPCPLCAPWEGAILSEGADPSGQSSATVQDAESSGLFHANCGHTLDGVSQEAVDQGLVHDDSEAMTDDEQQSYEDAQQQRALERQVRQWKMRQSAAITPQAAQQSADKVAQYQAQLRQFTTTTGLPRYYGRESITKTGGRDIGHAAASEAKAPVFAPNEVEPWNWKGNVGRITEEDRYRAAQGWQDTFAGNTYIKDNPLSPAAQAMASAVDSSPQLLDATVYKGVWSQAGGDWGSMKVGDTVDFKTISSTTPSKEYARDYTSGKGAAVLEIVGGDVRDVAQYLPVKTGETILKPGRFVVESIRKEKIESEVFEVRGKTTVVRLVRAG